MNVIKIILCSHKRCQNLNRTKFIASKSVNSDKTYINKVQERHEYSKGFIITNSSTSIYVRFFILTMLCIFILNI